MLTPDFSTFDCRDADLQRRGRLEERVRELMTCKELAPTEHEEYHRTAVELLVRWRDMVIVPANASADDLVRALRGLGYHAASGRAREDRYFWRVVVVFERPWPSRVGSTEAP